MKYYNLYGCFVPTGSIQAGGGEVFSSAADDGSPVCIRPIYNSAGNLLWKHSETELFGKPVYTSPFMPETGAGAKPVLFGDFSYLWLLERGEPMFRTCNEIFLPTDRTGIYGSERIDCQLVKRDAVKALLCARNAE
jgi:HK97 family phage major capsid protein